MAKKRSKPIAEHIETTASPETPPVENQVPPVAPEPPVPETNEPVKSHADQLPPRRMHGDPKGGMTRAQRQPNVTGEYNISLTDSNDGPKMRMLRERTRYGDLAAFTFDEKPGDDIRQRLKDAGFSWAQADHAWKKPLGEHPGVEHRKAQELFESIANGIRAANGLEPVTSLGNGVA